MEIEIDIKKQKEAMMKKLGKLPDNKLTKKLKMQQERERSGKCKLARMVMFEALDMYENGMLSWEEMVADINDNLEAMKAMKDKEEYEDEEMYEDED